MADFNSDGNLDLVAISENNPVSFDIATGCGSATAGSDYLALSQAGRRLDAVAALVFTP